VREAARTLDFSRPVAVMLIGLAYEKQRHRTQAEVSRFFDGLELIDPGVVAVQNWRPDSEIEARAKSAMWAA
jgi:S-adenosyl methyltransferase